VADSRILVVYISVPLIRGEGVGIEIDIIAPENTTYNILLSKVLVHARHMASVLMPWRICIMIDSQYNIVFEGDY